MPDRAAVTRAIALVGPGGAGKTSLAEALLFASGTVGRLGSVEAGTSLGDASPEARARGSSTELNLFHFRHDGDRFALLDCPGSVGFAADGVGALAIADLALVVIDPDPDRAALVEPVLRSLEAAGIPHMLFVNRIDGARGTIHDLLEALQPMSGAPIVARQIAMREGDKVVGFVDLALERAFRYRPGKPSERHAIPDGLAEREAAARFHMLEQLADHDDALLEQLLMDETPPLETIFADITKETGAGLIVPLLFGSAANGFGIRRLLKALRHDTPPLAATAARLGAGTAAARIFKISHGGTMGRLAFARIFAEGLREGSELASSEGPVRVGSLFHMQGERAEKAEAVAAGDVVAIAKAEGVAAGDWLAETAAALPETDKRVAPTANHVLAIRTRDRKDDVRLSGALHKLTEEDAALAWEQDEALHETRLRGINDEHLKVVLDRLARRYGVAVEARPPAIAYRESVRKAVTQRGRHKKQSGGHGQFGDVVIELSPQPRGAGFAFDERISGGVVPRQWIPAVEAGIRDAMASGPLGYPVVDVAVTLIDGSYHSVDSSEIAFRTAGRIAASEALRQAAPFLLEPVLRIAVFTPASATSRATSAIAARRGQMLGLAPRDGWARWDRIEALVPEAQMQGFDAELRSLSQGLAHYEATFDHLAELSGKLAEEVTRREPELA